MTPLTHIDTLNVYKSMKDLPNILALLFQKKTLLLTLITLSLLTFVLKGNPQMVEKAYAANTNLTVCTYKSGAGLINANVTISGYSTVATGTDGCNNYNFVSGKSLTITAAASSYYTQSRTITLTSATQRENFYLQAVPPPVQNTSLTVCTYKSGAGLINANVTISGYNTVATGTDGCNNYTFNQGKSLSITSAASGYYSQTRNVSLTSTTQRENFYLQAVPPPVQNTNLTVCIYKNGGGLISGNVTIKDYNTVATGSDGCNSYVFTQGKTLSITAKATNYTQLQRNVKLSSATQRENFYLTPSCYSISGEVFYDANQDGSKGGTTSEPFVSGAGVTLSGGYSATTDSVGKYKFSCVAPGSRTLKANKTSYTGFSGSVNITQNVSSLRLPLRKTVVTPSEYILTVKTLAATGQSAPISGASVYVCPTVVTGTGAGVCPSGETDSSGIARIKLSAAVTSVSLTISGRKGSLSGEVELAKGTTLPRTVTMTLQAPKEDFKITGKVTNIAGTAITSATIKATNVSTGRIFSTSSLSTGILGSYTLNITEKGTYSLEAITSAPNYQGSRSLPNIVFNDTSPLSVTRNFTLSAATGKFVIKGTITEAKTGKVVSGAGIHLHNKTKNSYIVASSNTSGKYAVFTDEEGTYELEVTPGQSTQLQGAFSRPDFVFNNSSAKELSRNITLQPKVVSTTPSPCVANSSLCITPSVSKQVKGKIINSNNSLYKGTFAISLRNTRTGTTANRTTSNGTFVFDNLSSTKETYTLTATPQDNSVISSANPLTVTVDAGQTYAATFTVSTSSTEPEPSQTEENPGITPVVTSSPSITNSPTPSCYTIYGDVFLDANGNGLKDGGSNEPWIKDAQVSLTGVTSSQTTTETGDFRFNCVTGNNLTLSFTKSGIQTLQKTVNASTTTSSIRIAMKPMTISTPTATPTVITATQIPTGTTNPTPSTSTTPVIPNNKATLNLQIGLQGIGSIGDTASPELSTFSNKNPFTIKRDLTVNLFNTDNIQVQELKGNITYNSDLGLFTGTIETEPLTSGFYRIKVKTGQNLSREYLLIFSLREGQSTQLPPLTVIAGDVNDDNVLDILDYHLIAECVSDFRPAVSCKEGYSLKADLNDDGKVNQVDLNLILRNFYFRRGD
ncbi:MAG: hypothetical protein QG600_124 [Patescibacteria group bacterium]|nr:hypothetical protein [Patescibacteria group bacterium]